MKSKFSRSRDLSCAQVLVQRILKRGPETRKCKKEKKFSTKKERGLAS